MARTLLIISPEWDRPTPEEQRRRESAGESPRSSVFDDMVATDVIDSRYLRSRSWLKRVIYKPIPKPVVQSVEAFRRRRAYDVILTWDNRVVLLFALLHMLFRSRSHHVAMANWMLSPTKRRILRLVCNHIDHVIVWGDMHKELLAEFCGIPRSRITTIPWPVDTQFWTPNYTNTDMICAVGDSRRDYPTLLRAMEQTSIPCRLATRTLARLYSARDYDTTRQALAQASVPEHVTIKPASSAELREVYARSRFVVVPLVPGFNDNGVTVIHEAMAAGKAVVASRTYGILDEVEHGVTGILVPPQDPEALRDAILSLWTHPEIAERMGREARRRAEARFDIARFSACVKAVVDEVAQGGTRSKVVAPPEAGATSGLRPVSKVRGR